MTGKRVKRRWRICWKFISPLIILGVIIGGLVQMIRDMADGKYTYTAWDRNKVISLKKLILNSGFCAFYQLAWTQFACQFSRGYKKPLSIRLLFFHPTLDLAHPSTRTVAVTGYPIFPAWKGTIWSNFMLFTEQKNDQKPHELSM